jgi:hypothetical protein
VQKRKNKKSGSLTCHLDRSIMHFILQQNHLFYLLCIFITQTISTPITNFFPTKQSDGSEENFPVDQDRSFILKSDALSTTIPYPSTSNTYSKRNSYELNLKIIAIFMACFIFGFVIGRLCLMIYNSTHSSSRVLSNRRTSVVRPQIAIIGQNRFKPDLPPAYAEAVANIDNDESKLPSYQELRNANI